MSDFEIIIKSSDKKVPVSVNNDTLVSKVKEQMAKELDIPVERQRLIYSGRVLKDGETVGSYNIKEGHSVHLVKGAAPQGSSAAPAASATSATPNTTSSNPASTGIPNNIASGAGAGNPLAALTGAQFAGHGINPQMFGDQFGQPPSEEDFLNMMRQPGYRESVEAMLNNPQMLDMMINSNPQLAAMGPQARQMLQSDHMRQMMTNPEVMQGMMQIQRAMNPEAQGSAFPAPGAAPGAAAGAEGAAAGAAAGGAAGGANANNMANFMQMMGGGGFGGFGGNAFSAPAAPAEPEDTRPPEERYESQLRQLNELGFYEFDRNVRALRRSGGNVQGAIEALLDGGV
ncbi:Ubiquitin domain-containing protein [Yarrowia sp. C11]|nr:Ubiquitin domain-containing protein [Yarrowia sp. E02]KAG5372267.1 Ubiquitin domain-containing protein [Yarrowia sp. C11]